MTFTAHPGSIYNVRGSFNNFFKTQITGAGLPAFMSIVTVNFDFPENPLTFPSFSVTHLGNETREVAQGRHLDNGWKGVEQIGLADIRCWESVQRASGQHGRNLAIMRDMAARVFATGAWFNILDVHGSTAGPTANGTIVRTGPTRAGSVARELNSDVTAERLLVEYRWLERVTAG